MRWVDFVRVKSKHISSIFTISHPIQLWPNGLISNFYHPQRLHFATNLNAAEINARWKISPIKLQLVIARTQLLTDQYLQLTTDVVKHTYPRKCRCIQAESNAGSLPKWVRIHLY
jgi:hypothetical protein